MFIGHYAVALAAKKAAPNISLGTLLIASVFPDLLFPALVLFGLEHVEIDPGNTAMVPLNFTSYPYSHSLLGTLVWAGLFVAVFYFLGKDRKTALWLGAVLISHWLLDFISHGPDLQLVPGLETRVGLGLWNSIAATVLIEGSLFIAGVILYLKSTAAKNKTGTIAFWSMIALLSLLYTGFIFGPPPPSGNSMAYVGLAQWGFAPWAFWIDHNRRSLQ
jgi:membrane-bound metal-dependent hydrolase YbcI (DUF457 family)